ncbi:kinase-like protein [Trametes coccinea BRFM310]|uniref:Kinase-like protein n=1 Tax=Trametes coccinea (strain BRFM310) TaxID=1353009 RepID=A0A1Y2IA25_TRAC3|nr:kinase-like protein [Trametes coccinea BRFM310]
MSGDDEYMDGLSMATASTQQATQSSQPASQPEEGENSILWGILIPCNRAKERIRLHKLQPEVRIGRDAAQNDVVLDHPYISKRQCTLRWDGDTTSRASVIVRDHSRFGTFINGKKIRQGEWQMLHDGNEIAFNTWKPQLQKEGVNDFRFIFRNTAYTSPSDGVHQLYDLQHELGSGSFATVMKALHRREGRWYAIKIIQAQKLQRQWTGMAIDSGVPSNEQTEYFIREIDILKSLRHRNICQFKEVFIQSHNIFLVMELVDGGDLLGYLLAKEKDGKRLSEALAQNILYQICDALAYVHRQGIAHRDLKLENVLLTNDFPPVVKVVDFGLAKVIDTSTAMKSEVGTAKYVAPEVMLHGPEGYGQEVDSWSVGIMTFIMLTMAVEPFIDDDSRLHLRLRLMKRAVNWDLLRGRVGQDGQDFIEQLLQFDPAHRMTLTQACNHPWLVNREEPRFFDSLIISDGPDAYAPIEVPRAPRQRAGRARCGGDTIVPVFSHVSPVQEAHVHAASPARTIKRKRDDRSSSWLYSESREDTVPPEGVIDGSDLAETPVPKRVCNRDMPSPDTSEIPGLGR